MAEVLVAAMATRVAMLVPVSTAAVQVEAMVMVGSVGQAARAAERENRNRYNLYPTNRRRILSLGHRRHRSCLM